MQEAVRAITPQCSERAAAGLLRSLPAMSALGLLELDPETVQALVRRCTQLAERGELNPMAMSQVRSLSARCQVEQSCITETCRRV